MGGSGRGGIIAVAAFGAGLAGGWFAGQGGAGDARRVAEDAVADVKAQIARADELERKAAANELRLARLQTELSAAAQIRSNLEKANEEILREVMELRGRSLPADAAAPEASGAAADAAKTHFAFDRHAKSLAAVDWKTVAENVGAFPPLVQQVLQALREGREVSPEAAGELQRRNGPLVTVALRLGADIPGTGANGKFTHPAFSANAMASTLASLGKPLSAAQLTALEAVARRASDEDEERRAAYKDDVPALRRIADEADLRRRFYESARALLTPEQLETLSPAEIRDRLACDLWCEGLLWLQFARPVQASAPADLAKAALPAVAGMLRLSDADRARAEPIVADWAAKYPAAVLARPHDAYEKAFWVKCSVVAAAAESTLQLTQRLVRELDLSGPQAAGARSSQAVLVPVPTPGADTDGE